jgi:hypothetical protein
MLTGTLPWIINPRAKKGSFSERFYVVRKLKFSTKPRDLIVRQNAQVTGEDYHLLI